MKRCVMVLLLFAGAACAQPDWQGEPRPDRLEKFRKMRLVEELKLSEDDAVRFFAKQSAHEDKVRELMKTRNGIVDDLDSAVRSKEGAVLPLADRLMACDKSVFEERQRYQNEMRSFLSPVQFGKFLVFERNFGRQVREALEDLHEGRRRQNR